MGTQLMTKCWFRGPISRPRVMWWLVVTFLAARSGAATQPGRAGLQCAGGSCALPALLVASLTATQSSAAAELSLVLEDFESPALGGLPLGWNVTRSAGVAAGAGVERKEPTGIGGTKALKFDYTFPAGGGAAWVHTGPGSQSLPGGLGGLSAWIRGDSSGNTLSMRCVDRDGEQFEIPVRVDWSGWKRVDFALSGAVVTGGGAKNGVPDVPFTFQGIRLARAAGAVPRGEILLDLVTAECRYSRLATLYDPASGVRPELWKATMTRSRVARASAGSVVRAGRPAPALQLEWEHEGAPGAAVEFTRNLDLGPDAPGGTLIAEVFGDGSQAWLQFLLRDARGRRLGGRSAGFLVDWSGWRTVYVDMRTLFGAAAAVPAAFEGIAVVPVSTSDALPGVETSRRGELYLGRVLYGSNR